MTLQTSLFPPAWTWLVDEALPTYVKQNYSPKESWKNKPFSKEDAHFFFKGIEDLSELFTEERSQGIPPYFLHPKYRSAYLLYFLPLQAAKFLTLFQTHSKALEAALRHAKSTGILRVADLGAGPGTASLSLLVYLLKLPSSLIADLPSIELHLLDLNGTILKDGQKLLETFGSHFPKLRGKITVHPHTAPWWKAPTLIPGDFSLVLMGHVLNESSGPKKGSDQFWQNILPRIKGGGVLMIEPAARKPAQTLSSVRDFIFQSELLEAKPQQIWGPCLHAGNCPLAQGRDWCHFSTPVTIPGKWFKSFSVGLGSERDWLKFSYLWLASAEDPAPIPNSNTRRVISDPLNPKGQGTPQVLLCEPETPRRWNVPGRTPVYRGDLVDLKVSSAFKPAVGNPTVAKSALSQSSFETSLGKKGSLGKPHSSKIKIKPKLRQN